MSFRMGSQLEFVRLCVVGQPAEIAANDCRITQYDGSRKLVYHGRAL